MAARSVPRAAEGLANLLPTAIFGGSAQAPMTNKKCLLDMIASYSLDVTLAVGGAAACAAIALILSLSEPPLNASAVPWLAPEQFD